MVPAVASRSAPWARSSACCSTVAARKAARAAAAVPVALAYAKRVGDVAIEVAEQAVEAARPFVEQAAETARPLIEDARRTYRRLTRPGSSFGTRCRPFAEALAWLDQHINLEAQAGKVEGLSLERMRRLVDVLGDPQTTYPVIHLTGTNGKGSTARLITALLAEARLDRRHLHEPAPAADQRAHRPQRRADRRRRPGRRCWAISSRSSRLVGRPVLVLRAAHRRRVALVRRHRGRRRRRRGRPARPLRRHQRRATGPSPSSPTSAHDHTDLSGDWRARDRRGEGRHRQARQHARARRDRPGADARSSIARGAAEVWERDRDFACEAQRARRRRPAARPAHAVARAVRDVFLPLHGAHQGDNAAAALAAAEAFFGDRSTTRWSREAFASVTMPGGSRSSAASRSSCSTARTTPKAPRPRPRRCATTSRTRARRIIVVGMLADRAIRRDARRARGRRARRS